jgi:hypothetical protein
MQSIQAPGTTQLEKLRIDGIRTLDAGSAWDATPWAMMIDPDFDRADEEHLSCRFALAPRSPPY